jgi:hypothetical protein
MQTITHQHHSNLQAIKKYRKKHTPRTYQVKAEDDDQESIRRSTRTRRSVQDDKLVSLPDTWTELDEKTE